MGSRKVVKMDCGEASPSLSRCFCAGWGGADCG